MRRLSAGLAAALVVFLAIPRSRLDVPNPGSSGNETLAILAIGVGIVVVSLAGKATKEAAGRALAGRFLVCLILGGVIVPLGFLVLVSLLYFLFGGPSRAYVFIIGLWLAGLRAWVIGGLVGMIVAVFWPGRKYEAPGTAR